MKNLRIRRAGEAVEEPQKQGQFLAQMNINVIKGSVYIQCLDTYEVRKHRDWKKAEVSRGLGYIWHPRRTIRNNLVQERKEERDREINSPRHSPHSLC
jgi:hypothetical protein